MVKPKGTGKFFNEVQKALNGDQYEDELIINSGDRLTIETISDFAQQVRRGFAEAAAVVIEFRKNVDLDITALQVFCSACKTALASGKKLSYRGPLPATLLHLATTVGLERSDSCNIDTLSCFRKFGGLK